MATMWLYIVAIRATMSLVLASWINLVSHSADTISLDDRHQKGVLSWGVSMFLTLNHQAKVAILSRQWRQIISVGGTELQFWYDGVVDMAIANTVCIVVACIGQRYGISHHGEAYFANRIGVGDIEIFNGYFGYSPEWFTSNGRLCDGKAKNSIEYAVGTLVTLSDRIHRGATSSFGHPK